MVLTLFLGFKQETGTNKIYHHKAGFVAVFLSLRWRLIIYKNRCNNFYNMVAAQYRLFLAITKCSNLSSSCREACWPQRPCTQPCRELVRGRSVGYRESIEQTLIIITSTVLLEQFWSTRCVYTFFFTIYLHKLPRPERQKNMNSWIMFMVVFS